MHFFVRVFMLTLLVGFPSLLHISISYATPNLYIDPPLTSTSYGSVFSVNVSIANVNDLGGWEFKFFYNNSILSGATAAEGPFLQQGGSTSFFIVSFDNHYNATTGRIWLTCVLLGHVPGVSGTGTLATITLIGVSGGNTTLHLADTVLGDSQAQPIVHTTTDGTVQITGIFDVAVTAVTPLKTMVGQGYRMRTNVTFTNQGDQDVVFNATTYANATEIATIWNLNLAAGKTVNATFAWNTTSFAKGTYTISGYAWPVLGETDTQDNNRTSSILVTVAMPGDLRSPIGEIDIKDVSFVARGFGTEPGHPLWNPNADINDDDLVDIKDVSVVAKNFGKTDP
jgi:hypothetical protein